MYCDSKLPEVARLIAAAKVPGNKGDVIVEVFRGPRNVNSYWDGGTKSEFSLVHLETLQAWHSPGTHPHYDRLPSGDRCGNLEINELPPGVCLIEGGTFCGKPATIRVMLRPENLAKMLPAPATDDLSEKALAALLVVGSIKGGVRGEYFQARGLGAYSGQNAYVQALADAGLVKVNKAGAVSITTAGRNRLQTVRGY